MRYDIWSSTERRSRTVARSSFFYVRFRQSIIQLFEYMVPVQREDEQSTKDEAGSRPTDPLFFVVHSHPELPYSSTAVIMSELPDPLRIKPSLA